MAIKSISKEKFDSYPSKKQDLSSFFSTEHQWYADDEKKIIGTVIEDKTDKDWAYIIMTLDSDKEYAYETGEVSLDSIELAKDKLLQKMQSM